MNRQRTTDFASVGGVRRCKSQAFFDKCLSTCNRMGGILLLPPAKRKSGGSDLLKAATIGMITDCYTTAFFLLPSCGRIRQY